MTEMFANSEINAGYGQHKHDDEHNPERCNHFSHYLQSFCFGEGEGNEDDWEPAHNPDDGYSAFDPFPCVEDVIVVLVHRKEVPATKILYSVSTQS